MSTPRGETGSPLSIVHVVAPAPFGGLEHVVYGLATGQQTRGHSVSVAALIGEEPIPLVERLEAAGVPVQRFDCGRHYLRERRELVRYFQAATPNLVHTHGYRPDVQGGAAARRVALPAVSTIHGFTGGDAKNRLYEGLQRRALRRFSAVVAVSRPLVERLVAGGVARERVHLVPNAYQIEYDLLSRAQARAALGLRVAETAFVIGWVGRLSREKGPDVLVEALALLADRNAHAAVIGDGPDRAALGARVAALGLGDRVHWLGIVAGAARCFPAFDCFVLSSRTEGTPIVLFEAMAAQVPIVAASVGGVPDVVSSEEAVLVPPEDPDALARALRQIAIDAPGAAARADRAAGRLRAERNPDRWLAEYEGVYRSLARPQPRFAA